MTRKKVTLAYIANDSARKATFRKRKKGLLKKVSELSTLCGIEACAIIYSAYDTEPEVWPSAIGACRAIANFRNIPEMDQSKRMVNQPTFLLQRIGKAEEQLKKLQKDNREKEVAQLMYRALAGPGLSLQGLSLLDLNDLGWMVDKTLMEIDEKVKSLQQSPPPPPPPPPEDDNHQASETHHGSTTWDTGRTNTDNDKGRDQNEEAAKRINSAIAVALDAMHNNQTWFMELLKPSEGLLGLSRFNNGDNNNNNSSSNNNGMAMPLPPPPLPHPLPPYPCPGQSVAPWPNFFFP